MVHLVLLMVMQVNKHFHLMLMEEGREGKIQEMEGLIVLQLVRLYLLQGYHHYHLHFQLHMVVEVVVETTIQMAVALELMELVEVVLRLQLL